MAALQVIVFMAGLILTGAVALSAIKTFVLPRSGRNWVARAVFRAVRMIFDLLTRLRGSYEARDALMAFYAPVGLLSLLAVWLFMIWVAFGAMFWATGPDNLYYALRESGSSLTTLGFEGPRTAIHTALTLAEAAIGLMLVALLISYLPSIYSAFARRESQVTLLEVRAGAPPSAVEMLVRYHRIHGLGSLGEQWQAWEQWFADIDESHTSLAALVFFRSPRPEHSWVTAAGAILDSAALTRSIVDLPADPRADLCIRAGFLALRHISDFFDVDYNADPHYPADPVSVTRAEFDEACRGTGVGRSPVKGRPPEGVAGLRGVACELRQRFARAMPADDGPLCALVVRQGRRDPGHRQPGKKRPGLHRDLVSEGTEVGDRLLGQEVVQRLLADAVLRADLLGLDLART